MPKYFETFYKRLYDIANTGNPKLVTDIFRRLKVRDGIKDNLVLYASYDVTPVIHQKVYHINILVVQIIFGNLFNE